MQTLLHRLFSRPGTRASDAAGGGRRWDGGRSVDQLNSAILAGATTAAQRAGWYARNNPWVAATVDSLVGNVVGAGIKPHSTHLERAVRDQCKRLEQDTETQWVALGRNESWEISFRQRISDASLVREPDVFAN